MSLDHPPHQATTPGDAPQPTANQAADHAVELGAPTPAAAAADPTRDQTHVYGSFWIGDTEFALPVTVLQEVVNEPDSYTPVPLSPPHIVGLFELRRMIVPVIDLRILLGFPDPPSVLCRKIAIIENGALCIGVLFDDTGGVINANGIGRVNFQPTDEGVKDVIVEGVLKLDDGKRMVQVLDPYEILKIEKLPRIHKTANTGGPGQLGRRLSCISFQLGHTTCAIDLRYVQEITDFPEMQHSQIAHGHILGNIELRGRTMPIVDFRGMIGNEEPFKFSAEALRSRKLVILDLAEGRIGLVVYSIDSIMSFFEADVLPFANVAIPRHDIVAGCLINDMDEIVILLDHEQLLRDKTLVDAARSCQEIYPSDEKKTQKECDHSKPVNRATYILFSADMPFAFEVSHVSEIIDRPDKLLKPPYALEFVDGILHLRGELITLINPRVLYNLPPSEEVGSKIIIFRKDGVKYGLLVDTIDEIVTAQTNELISVPQMSRSGRTRLVSEDVEGCLHVPHRGHDVDPVMVLNVTSLISRCVGVEDVAV